MDWLAQHMEQVFAIFYFVIGMIIAYLFLRKYDTKNDEEVEKPMVSIAGAFIAVAWPIVIVIYAFIKLIELIKNKN